MAFAVCWFWSKVKPFVLGKQCTKNHGYLFTCCNFSAGKMTDYKTELTSFDGISRKFSLSLGYDLRKFCIPIIINAKLVNGFWLNVAYVKFLSGSGIFILAGKKISNSERFFSFCHFKQFHQKRWFLIKKQRKQDNWGEKKIIKSKTVTLSLICSGFVTPQTRNHPK